MKYSELASRYASALYELAGETKSQDLVFSEVRELNKIFSIKEIFDYMSSPVVQPSEKREILKKAFNNNGVSEGTQNFVLTLAKKGRLSIFSEVVIAFQSKNDEVNGVRRGEVTSSNVLAPEERAELTKTVEKVTGKKVILSYEENPDLIGGLIAKVGSYTFDDTLTSHLRRLQEDIKRRAH
ncbi:MAG: ATP synthase F1 subunit delta [Bdellovibrionaceae bacterium]|nr:ATP synthase F1 subunit delta [Pseudobdellovibrionaceae bacterium]